MKFAKAKDLLLDRCPKCEGIWLDKGELAKVEGIAANLSDAKSKIILVCKHFKKNGCQILEGA